MDICTLIKDTEAEGNTSKTKSIDADTGGSQFSTINVIEQDFTSSS